jgi:cytochrome c-type biogenesis protein CcmH/NrfF
VNGTSVQQAYFDGANAWVNGSSVRYAHFNGAVSASFRASSLTEIVAQGESSIQLVDSSYGSIQTEDNATVLVGWQLPIFGVVAMPYAWIPIIQTGAALTILIVSTVLLVFAYRRWKRQQDEKLRKLAESENQSIARLLR